MSFDTLEDSVQDSEPRELITISHGDGAVVHRIATGTRDIVYQGQIYGAIPAARGDIGIVGVGTGDKETTITLPGNHAFVKRWLQHATPPKKPIATILRLQSDDSVEQQWTGEITGLSFSDDGTEATFRVPSRLGRSLLRVIPSTRAGRTCLHPLYGSMCKIDRAGTNPDGIAYEFSTTVQHVNGREVRLDLSNVPANNAHRATWAVGGELKHVASGEIFAVEEQSDLNPGFSTVTILTLESVLPDLKVGDTVKIAAGCKKDIATCSSTKFSNRHNFGGLPRMPLKNIFRPANTGVSETGEF